MYKILMTAIGASMLLPATAFAGCGAQNTCLSWTSAPQAAAPYMATANHNAPNYQMPNRLEGLAPSESLCPTSCAVTVHNPEAGKVLDC